MKTRYDPEADALYHPVSARRPDGAIEVADGINIDTTRGGEITGVEILNVSERVTLERDGRWYIAYCEAIPGANGQGKTKEKCLGNLADAIALIVEDQRSGETPWDESRSM